MLNKQQMKNQYLIKCVKKGDGLIVNQLEIDMDNAIDMIDYCYFKPFGAMFVTIGNIWEQKVDITSKTSIVRWLLCNIVMEYLQHLIGHNIGYLGFEKHPSTFGVFMNGKFEKKPKKVYNSDDSDDTEDEEKEKNVKITELMEICKDTLLTRKDGSKEFNKMKQSILSAIKPPAGNTRSKTSNNHDGANDRNNDKNDNNNNDGGNDSDTDSNNINNSSNNISNNSTNDSMDGDSNNNNNNSNNISNNSTNDSMDGHSNNTIDNAKNYTSNKPDLNKFGYGIVKDYVHPLQSQLSSVEFVDDFDSISLISDCCRCFDLNKNEQVVVFDSTENVYGNVGTVIGIDSNANIDEKFLVKLDIKGKECIVGSWSIQPESSGFGNMFVQTILDTKCDVHELRLTDTLVVMSKGHLFELYKHMFDPNTMLYKELMKRGNVKVFIEKIRGLVTIRGQNALYASVKMKYNPKDEYQIPINACYLHESNIKHSDDVVMVEINNFGNVTLDISSKFSDSTTIIKTLTNHGGSAFVRCDDRENLPFMQKEAPLVAECKDPLDIWKTDDVSWDSTFNRNRLYVWITSRISGVRNFMVKQGSLVVIATGDNARYVLCKIEKIDVRWQNNKYFPVLLKKMQNGDCIIDSGYLLPYGQKLPVVVDDCWGDKRTVKQGDVFILHSKTPHCRKFSKYLTQKLVNVPQEGLLAVLDSDVSWGETSQRIGGVLSAYFHMYYEWWEIKENNPSQFRVHLPVDMVYLLLRGNEYKHKDIETINYFTKWIDDEILTINGRIPQGDGGIGVGTTDEDTGQ